ncbi:MAG: class I SAM-dependent methyltransferase [Oligoflexia bacterium]|nr:class I SAM-dependent methyltransferase [Oligoflexia bacterium]
MDSQVFEQILEQNWPELSPTQRGKVVQFRELVVSENARQNLTKLTSPTDFYFGHVLDVQMLLRFPKLEYPAVDLGSGCGVPGLLSALVSDGKWFLVESEGRKAAFLKAAVESLGLEKQVEVRAERLESWLSGPQQKSIASIVARAVGPVGRIYGWIRHCSTWNNLILLKGPGWTTEWGTFSESSLGKELNLAGELQYVAGPEEKFRTIIRLDRVPRGTFLKTAQKKS